MLYKAFKVKGENNDNEHHAGNPLSFWTSDIGDKMLWILVSDRQMNVRMIYETLGSIVSNIKIKKLELSQKNFKCGKFATSCFFKLTQANHKGAAETQSAWPFCIPSVKIQLKSSWYIQSEEHGEKNWLASWTAFQLKIPKENING